jgi:hypothetical protein
VNELRLSLDDQVNEFRLSPDLSYAPPPCPPCDSWPDEALAEYVYRRRSSIFTFRRRQAYRVLCDLLIPRREVACGFRQPDAFVRRHL